MTEESKLKEAEYLEKLCRHIVVRGYGLLVVALVFAGLFAFASLAAAQAWFSFAMTALTIIIAFLLGFVFAVHRFLENLLGRSWYELLGDK